ncbi:MAG: MFS transporter [Pseudomonadota bacterium]
MSRVADWFEGITLIRPNERRATLLSFVVVFMLMASYFVLRPVRDAMASDWSDAEVSLLWNLQFFLSAGLVVLYSFTVSRVKLERVVPGVYAMFALSFLAFRLGTPLVSDPTLLEKGFYMWVSAFSLFNVSVFWSFMANTFTPDQSRRLFATIGAGASAGAIVGPAVPTLFAQALGLEALLLIASGGLLAVVPVILWLQRMKVTQLDNSQHHLSVDDLAQPLGQRWWSGFRDVLRNRYLLAIAVFILLYVFIGSFVYFIQKNLLVEFTRVERTQILSGISWLVNTLTFICALLVTGRLVRRCGMATTLALLPLVLLVGMAALAFAPMIVLLLAVDVARRVGNYAVTRPAREMLFTQVSTDQRFKAKPVLDVVVYRGGDAISGSLFALLSEGLALGLGAISLVGSAVAALWTVVALYLGRRYKRMEPVHDAASSERPARHQHPVNGRPALSSGR